MVKKENYYFNLKQIRSYNIKNMFVFGGRGIGKTYSTKNWAVERAIKNCEFFAWLVDSDKTVKELTKRESPKFIEDCPILIEGYYKKYDIQWGIKELKKLSTMCDILTNQTEDNVLINKLKTLKKTLTSEIKKLNIEILENTVRFASGSIFYNNKEIGVIYNVHDYEKLKGIPLARKLKRLIQDEFLGEINNSRNKTSKDALFSLAETFGRTQEIEIIGLSNLTIVDSDWSEIIPFHLMKEGDIKVIRNLNGEPSCVVQFAKTHPELLLKQKSSSSGKLQSLNVNKNIYKGEFDLPDYKINPLDFVDKTNSFYYIKTNNGNYSFQKLGSQMYIIYANNKCNSKIVLNNFISTNGTNLKTRIREMILQLAQAKKLCFDSYKTATGFLESISLVS